MQYVYWLVLSPCELLACLSYTTNNYISDCKH